MSTLRCVSYMGIEGSLVQVVTCIVQQTESDDSGSSRKTPSLEVGDRGCWCRRKVETSFEKGLDHEEGGDHDASSRNASLNEISHHSRESGCVAPMARALVVLKSLHVQGFRALQDNLRGQTGKRQT